MLFIGPPFGNYVSLPGTISIKGSFTLEPRDGLLSQIVKTLRYSFEHKGWINKIGLRNPGIDAAIKNWKNDKVIHSIAILDKKEIPKLVEKIPEDMDLELNVSCPNAEKKMITEGLGLFLNDKRRWCIIKLAPKTKHEIIDEYYKQGFRQFHCSNTLPTPTGGLSGPALIPYTTNLVYYIKKKYPETEVIAGGGIQSIQQLNKYKNIGANHFAVSTLLFHPILTGKFFYYFYKNKK